VFKTLLFFLPIVGFLIWQIVSVSRSDDKDADDGSNGDEP
jgi:hypothetical protein